MKTPKEIQERLPDAACSAAPAEPLMPYDEWLALGPEKAAEYLASRRGYSAGRQGKLRTILEKWGMRPPNSMIAPPT